MSSDADPGVLLADVEADLRTRRFWLRFSPEVERRYAAMIRLARVRHVVRFSVVGILLYNVFLLTDRLLMPDVFARALVMQLVVITPVCLVVLYSIHRRKRFSEPVVAAAIGMMTAATMLLFCWSQAPEAGLMPFTFQLFVMSADLLVPLSFPLATLFTVLTALAGIACVELHPGLDTGMRQFTALMVASSSTYSLIACYRMEASERAAYLLTLRETLRAAVLTLNNQRLRSLSDTDGLTRIGNRRFFDTVLDRLWDDAQASGQPVGLMMVDIDHFKQLNDTHGHLAGDRCLVLVADLLRDMTRGGNDVAARFGGEEFGVLLPGATLARVQDVAERLRMAVEAVPGPSGQGIRISVGCASAMPCGERGAGDLLAEADRALYCAKRAGRNRIYPPAPLAA